MRFDPPLSSKNRSQSEQRRCSHADPESLMEIYLLPPWLFNWIGSRGLSDPGLRIHLGYFLSNVLVVALLPLAHLVPHFCLMQAVVGIPCPGCGITHSLLLVMSLHFRDSVTANPAALVVAATMVFQLVGRSLAILCERASPFVTRASRWLGQASVFSLLTVWVATLIKLAV